MLRIKSMLSVFWASVVSFFDGDKQKYFEAVNWNKSDDGFTQMMWEQNLKQMWKEGDVPVAKDLNVWNTLSAQMQLAYLRVLAGLTALDTNQGTVGMNLILDRVKGNQRKAVLSFMGMMENIHAKSYSRIFSTLCVTELSRIDEIFEWARTNAALQRKIKLVSKHYRNLAKKRLLRKCLGLTSANEDLYMALVSSLFSESFLFYSGFFYPLYMDGGGYGKSMMTSSAEIIKLILRDESTHATYTAMLAQELYQQFTTKQQMRVLKKIQNLLSVLYENELVYTKEVYTDIGLVEEVNQFLRYNANKSMSMLSLDPIFDEEDINPIVENGLSTETANHDYFSQIGNGYEFTIEVVPLQDKDFEFEIEDEFGDMAAMQEQDKEMLAV